MLTCSTTQANQTKPTQIINTLLRMISKHPSLKSSFHLLLILFLVLVSQHLNTKAQKNITCFEKEREALLKFKNGIKNDYCSSMISSWGSQQSDCCKWNGVSCSNQTGHVIRLDLHGHVSPEYNKNFYCLQGIIDDSLADLKHLEYLDLSSNMLKSQSIPSFIGSLSNLKYLNLSRPYYSLGDLPQDLVNLSQLITLDLSGIDLSLAMGWFDIINTLPSLTNVWLDRCNLPSISYEPLFQIDSLSKFEVISLAENDLHDSYFIQWLFNLSTVNVHLKHIDLSHNSIEGTFPVTIGKLESLEFLDFSGNSISGPIPNTLTNIRTLSYLDLSDNNLEGTIPDGMGKLEFLEYLDLSFNSLVGLIPSAFRYMHVLSYLDLSNNKLEGRIPSEFGDVDSVLVHLDLSNNRLKGMIPDTIGNLKSVTLLSLSNNLISGKIPDTFRNLNALEHLDLSKNSISGIIPDFLELISPLKTLNLANNLLIGAIPSQLGMLQQLDFVDFSFNRLSGPIPWTLEIFGVEAFEGNANLRGLPLSAVFPLKQEGDVSSERTSDDNFYLGLYVSVGLGFLFGFWGVCASFVLKDAWRHSIFRVFDRIINKIYLTIAIFVAKFKPST